ncbi:MAG: hypothetical protein ACE5GE_03040 [Phycisphaerae bacterium]
MENLIIRSIRPGSWLTACALLYLLSGCAPATFDRAVAYYAQKYAVTDAAARRTSASHYYRFNAATLGDLDEALAQSDEAALRRLTGHVFRRANLQAKASTANEIERLPQSGRDALAVRAEVDVDSAALTRRFNLLADEALQRDLDEINRIPQAKLRSKLKAIRAGVEPLPDDRGRVGRQSLLFWGAIPAWAGVAREESKLPAKRAAKTKKTFDRVALWRPPAHDLMSSIVRFAPLIAVEWPQKRAYDRDDDRIGAVRLSGTWGQIEVGIEPSDPVVYTFASQAKINDRTYLQVNYVWWFPERPPMIEDDPAAGPIDGGTLRITLDAQDQPAIVESSLNCGCAHEVFVSKELEAAARREFGPPLEGKQFSVERHIPGKHDVIVIDTFTPASVASQPLVLLAAGYHEVDQVKFIDSGRLDSMQIVEDLMYGIRDYDALDRLKLGDGIGSMFGPDGLVHNAGRREGYLLAPTGILSAGQPRKRGTQRIRWDDFLLDDPHLLEKTLRIPSSF